MIDFQIVWTLKLWEHADWVHAWIGFVEASKVK